MSDVHKGDTPVETPAGAETPPAGARTPAVGAGAPPPGAEETAEVPARVSGVADDAPAPRAEDWRTTELQTPYGVLVPPGLWLFFLLFAAAGFLVGVGVASATKPGLPGAVISQATVGPDGAAIGFGERGVIRIPDGALARPVRIEVRRSVVRDRLRVSPPEGPLYVFERNRLVAYTFAPATATFAEPVTVVLPLERKGRSGTAFVVSGNNVLFLPGKVDPKAGTVTITVTDFRFGGGSAGRTQ